jgi:hypothetical protein
MFQAMNTHLQEVTLYTCSIWYRHSLWAFMVSSRYTLNDNSFNLCTDRPPQPLIERDSTICCMYTIWPPEKHVEECNIIWINNNLCIKLVIIIVFKSFFIVYVNVMLKDLTLILKLINCITKMHLCRSLGVTKLSAHSYNNFRNTYYIGCIWMLYKKQNLKILYWKQ